MISISADIIILGIIAGVILYKLFTILGSKDTDGNIPMPEKASNIDNFIDISKMVKIEDIEPINVEDNELIKGFEEIVSKIKKIDPKFSLSKFLEGAKVAFEMILDAFAKNDDETLKELLDNNTYKQFKNEIDKRVKNGITLNIALVSLPVVKINDIQMRNNKVFITVFYNSQQINILKNAQGETVEGNNSQIDNIEDTWVFSKELNGRQNWALIQVNAS